MKDIGSGMEFSSFEIPFKIIINCWYIFEQDFISVLVKNNNLGNKKIVK